MESPGMFPESPMEQDDVPFPCKGCGEVCDGCIYLQSVRANLFFSSAMGRFSRKARRLNSVGSVIAIVLCLRPHILTCLVLQRGTDGTLNVSAAVPAALCSIPMHTYYFSEMDR